MELKNNMYLDDLIKYKIFLLSPKKQVQGRTIVYFNVFFLIMNYVIQ
jgi:hypothetical protein